MEKDMIITLDDETSYALLDETTLQDKKYFFAVKLDEKIIQQHLMKYFKKIMKMESTI